MRRPSHNAVKKFIVTLVTGLFCIIQNSQAGEDKSKAGTPTVKMIFVGDIVLDKGPGEYIAAGKDPFAEFAQLFQQADIRVANLECVVATDGHPSIKMFTFRAHPRTLPYLKQHIDAVSIANNHSGDFGPQAFSEMLSLLDQEKIARFGGGKDVREAHQPLIIEKKGIKIALLGYNEFMPRSFEAGINSPGTAWSEDEQVVADIQNARSRYHADIVIPFMHWGWENEMKAGPRQRLLARKMIDAGADIVIGGHPHVIQDTEEYKGKQIIYSLGNFMIDALDNDEQTRGWLVQLEVSKHGVKAWTTRMVHIDDQGIPSLGKEASACWKDGSKTIQQCLAE